MGGDGGTIPGRDVLVKLKRRAAIDSDPLASAADRLLYCALTSELLRRPFVACMLGNLYNKDALITHILSKADKPAFRHIRGLKDVITCTAVFDTSDASSPPRFKCPVTGLVANGRATFVVVRPCGCIVSLKSITDLSSPSSTAPAACPACSGPLLPASVRSPGEPSYVPLAPTQDVADRLRGYLAAARAREERAKAEKKAKKRAAEPAEPAAGDEVEVMSKVGAGAVGAGAAVGTTKEADSKVSGASESSIGGNAATESAAAPVKRARVADHAADASAADAPAAAASTAASPAAATAAKASSGAGAPAGAMESVGVESPAAPSAKNAPAP